jgi:hypothetical protein
VAVEGTRTQVGVILHKEDEGLLEPRWLDVDMGDDEFKATLVALADQAEVVRPRAILIDATTFRHRPGDGVMEWRDQKTSFRVTSLPV